MRKFIAKRLSKRFLKSEEGAEVTELGIVLALIVVGAVALMPAIGTAVTAAYQAVSTALAN